MRNNIIKILILNLVIMFVIYLGVLIGIDLSIRTLLLVMAIDYMLGLSLAVIGQSKHGDGKLSSKIGFKGIVKKVTILLLVGLASIIELYLANYGLNTKYMRELTIMGFAINEIISIIENAKLTGLKIPKIINKILDEIYKHKK